MKQNAEEMYQLIYFYFGWKTGLISSKYIENLFSEKLAMLGKQTGFAPSKEYPSYFSYNFHTY